MTGISMERPCFGREVSWAEFQSFVDVGCAQGCVPVQLALAHPHLKGVGFDLAPVGPVFEEYVKSLNLQDRLTFRSGDMFSAAPLPETDVLIFGHILHDWDLPTKHQLLEKAYSSLKPGGAVIVYEALIDDDRRQNAFGLLMSLNMLIETEGGFDTRRRLYRLDARDRFPQNTG
jgi:SAM-dependent methyltransferase